MMSVSVCQYVRGMKLMPWICGVSAATKLCSQACDFSVGIPSRALSNELFCYE